MKSKALFLDRDGVINFDSGYTYKKEDIVFVDGIFDVVTAATDLGFMTVVITNQSGIGRGYYSEAEFLELSSWIAAEFAKKGGVITRTYFCPDNPEKIPPNSESLCRKPSPWLIHRAAHELGIDKAASIWVGDTETDVLAANRAKLGRIFSLGRETANSICIRDVREVIPYLILLE